MSLLEKYQKIVVPKLKETLGISNILALPRVKKVVVSMGVSEAKESKEVLDEAINVLSAITGQKPAVCKAKQAIAGFKLRKGDSIGLKATLRRKRMNDFLEKLFVLVLPRLRDFKGFSEESFDSGFSFNIGFPDCTVFPEIDVNKIKRSFGLQVTVVTVNTKNKQEAKVLLEGLGLPFRRNNF